MELEWDEAKHERNLRERGIGFDAAALIFLGPTIEWEDDRKDYGEVRICAVGAVGDDVLTLVYTHRDGARRIISARVANRKERKRWSDEVSKTS